MSLLMNYRLPFIWRHRITTQIECVPGLD